MAIEALMNLFDLTNNDDIRRSVAYALGYVCSGRTYKSLFQKIQTVGNNGNSESSDFSNHVLAALVSSYAYCLCINNIVFDQDDMDLFSNLIKHSSDVVSRAVRTGFGRVLTDKSLLLGILDADYLQCYHALIGSTAYLFLYAVQETSENALADYIQANPIFLPLFVTELYHSIQHFDNNVLPIGGKEFDLAYGFLSM